MSESQKTKKDLVYSGNSLASYFADRTVAKFVESGLVNDETASLFNELYYNILSQRSGSTSYVVKASKDKLEILEKKIADHLGDDVDQWRGFTQLLGMVNVSVRMAESLTNEQHRNSPEDRFYKDLEENLTGKSEEEINAYLASYVEGSEKISIYAVQTMHPTIYHTIEMRKWQAETLQDMRDKLEETGKKPEAYTTISHTDPDYEEKAAKFEETFIRTGVGKVLNILDQNLDGFLESLKSGEADITPQRQVTVAQEYVSEQEFTERTLKSVRATLEARNAAIVKATCDLDLTDEQADKLDEAFVDVDEFMADKERFVLATWGRAADGDGRPLAGVFELSYAWKEDNRKLAAGEIEQIPVRDLRHNSQMAIDSISMLIQSKFKEEFRELRSQFNPSHKIDLNEKYARHQLLAHPDKYEFLKLCADFVMEERERYAKAGKVEEAALMDKFVVGDHLFEEMPEESQTLFLQKVLNLKGRLIPENVEEAAIRYADRAPEMWVEYRDELIAGGKKDRFGKDMNDITALADLTDEQFAVFNARISEELGVVMDRVEFGGKTPEGDAKTYLIRFRPKEQSFDLFADAKILNPEYGKPGKDDEPKYLDRNNGGDAYKVAQNSAFETIVRQVWTREQIKKGKESGGHPFAIRCQIAEYSSLRDGLATTALFESTGLIEVKKGIGEMPATVTKIHLEQQPLFETLEDLRNGPDVLRQQISNKTLNSYYQVNNGVIKIMVGFSDGAKSCGEGPSVWEVYKFKRDMIKVAAEQGYKVRFFGGNGREEGRNGPTEGHASKMAEPKEVQEDCYLDRTDQSDDPQHAVLDPEMGTEHWTTEILGVIDGFIKRDPVERAKGESEADFEERMDSYEQFIDAVMNKSADHYQEVVEIVNDFHKNALKNPFKASRLPFRPGTSSDERITVDNIRAIDFLYGQAFIGNAVHWVGMKEGLLSGDLPKVTGRDADGKKVELSGMDAIKEVAKNHKVFAYILDQMEAGLHKYDQALMDTYTPNTLEGTKFVSNVKKSLKGGDRLLDAINKDNGEGKVIDLHLSKSKGFSASTKPDVSASRALDKIASATILASGNNSNLTDAEALELQNNAVFVKAQAVSDVTSGTSVAAGRAA